MNEDILLAIILGVLYIIGSVITFILLAKFGTIRDADDDPEWEGLSLILGGISWPIILIIGAIFKSGEIANILASKIRGDEVDNNEEPVGIFENQK